MKKGDIVLTPFPFTDLSTVKKRPALVLVEDGLNVTLAFITSNTSAVGVYDLFLKPNPTNRLKTDSIVKLNKIVTLDKVLILGKLGSLNAHELLAVNAKLTVVFDL